MYIRRLNSWFGHELYISEMQDDWNAHHIICEHGTNNVKISLLKLNSGATIEQAKAYAEEITFVIAQAALLRNENTND